VTTCIGCGCDEGHACVQAGGEACAWLEVSAGGLAGVCSACAGIFDRASIPGELLEAEASMIEHARREARGGLILPGDADFGL
jgi:hypothetical protein